MRIRENFVDVCFPEWSRFGMSLWSMTDGEHKTLVNFFSKCVFPPFGALVQASSISAKVDRSSRGECAKASFALHSLANDVHTDVGTSDIGFWFSKLDNVMS